MSGPNGAAGERKESDASTNEKNMDVDESMFDPSLLVELINQAWAVSKKRKRETICSRRN